MDELIAFRDFVGSRRSHTIVVQAQSLNDALGKESRATAPMAGLLVATLRQGGIPIAMFRLPKMLDRESPFRRACIPFYLLCVYTSRMASTTKLG